jgi:hypothetical protein
MTAPMTEPSTQGQLANIGFRTRQQERKQPGPGHYEIKVFGDTQEVTAGDGAFIFALPEGLDGRSLVDAQAFVTTVSSSGGLTIQISNVTQAADMLSTEVTIDAGDTSSYTATTPHEVDTANNQVFTGDLISIDVDGAGTGAMGLGVILRFY